MSDSLFKPFVDSKGQPLYLQLYHQLRDGVVNGQLRPGQRMPSSRLLARDLGLARGTVLLAYEQMTLEGYFIAQKGAGTYVAKAFPETFHPDSRYLKQPAKQEAPRPLSKRMALQFDGPAHNVMKPSQFRPFQPGLAPLDVLPRATLARLANVVYRSLPSSELGFGDGAGYRPLREALASYLGTTRGIACTADQVIVTTGSQQAFHLVCQVLLDLGDGVWMEDPGYGGARIAFAQSGQQIHPIPLDEEGLQVKTGTTVAPLARMAYVTPAHQYPSGVTMSLQRRLQLIRWASENETWILEDDYDGEFRYKGRPLATLHSLDPGLRVIYTGSLSKVLAPAFRLGYLIVPPDLIDPFRFAKSVSDRHSPTVQQAIMATFIAEGHFGRHLRRIRTLCKERQDILLDAAHRHLKDYVDVHPDPAGLHLVGTLKEDLDDQTISAAAQEQHLTIPPISHYSVQHPYRPSLLFGYSSFTQQELVEGIKRLATVF